MSRAPKRRRRLRARPPGMAELITCAVIAIVGISFLAAGISALPDFNAFVLIGTGVVVLGVGVWILAFAP